MKPFGETSNFFLYWHYQQLSKQAYFLSCLWAILKMPRTGQRQKWCDERFAVGASSASSNKIVQIQMSRCQERGWCSAIFISWQELISCAFPARLAPSRTTGESRKRRTWSWLTFQSWATSRPMILLAVKSAWRHRSWSVATTKTRRKQRQSMLSHRSHHTNQFHTFFLWESNIYFDFNFILCTWTHNMYGNNSRFCSFWPKLAFFLADRWSTQGHKRQWIQDMPTSLLTNCQVAISLWQNCVNGYMLFKVSTSRWMWHAFALTCVRLLLVKFSVSVSLFNAVVRFVSRKTHTLCLASFCQ